MVEVHRTALARVLHIPFRSIFQSFNMLVESFGAANEFMTGSNYYCVVQEDVDDDYTDEQAAERKGGDSGEETNAKGGRAHEHSLTRVPDSRIRKIISCRQAAAKRWKKV